jgi:hypothetical protein
MRLFLFIFLHCSLIPGFGQTLGVRNGHNMVYDPWSHRIILFGGADEARVYGDTWSYAEGEWQRLTESGPLPRTFPGMVMADHYILLFGGRQSGDQWIASDTWIFDGKGWSELEKPGPSARSGAVMSYDGDLHSLILFGGNPVISKEKNYNGPMWSWSGTEWHPIKSQDSLIFNCSMAFDANAHLLIRFGGWTGTTRTKDTWMYDSIWTKLILSESPPARNHSVMVYDADNKECILFGGHDGERVFGDMWAFKDREWILLQDKKPLQRIDNGH